MSETSNQKKDPSQEAAETAQLSDQELEDVSGGEFGPAIRGAVAGGLSPEADVEEFANPEAGGETETFKRS